MYAALMRAHTTLERSPEELHRLGRERTEVVLPEEYAVLGREVFGTTDLHSLFQRLRSDPKLRCTVGQTGRVFFDRRPLDWLRNMLG